MDPNELAAEKSRYSEEVSFYGCEPLRFFGSIGSLARDAGIPIYELADINAPQTLNWLQAMKVDLILLGGGWPQRLSSEVIGLPRLGVLNTHPSMLPSFRGTDVHRWQILAGVRQSGVTIHYVDETFDTGEILAQRSFDVHPLTRPQELADLAGRLAGTMMPGLLTKIEETSPRRLEGTAQKRRQDRSLYYSKWPWEDEDFLRIDWNRSGVHIQNVVLASSQESYKYNGPSFFVGGRKFVARDARLGHFNRSGAIGEVMDIRGEDVVVQCGEPNPHIALRVVQPATREGWPRSPHRARPMSGSAFAEEVGLRSGTILPPYGGGNR